MIAELPKLENVFESLGQPASRDFVYCHAIPRATMNEIQVS